MKQNELDSYFREFLKIDEFASIDPSQNGLQIANTGKEIKKIAFAVDACLETVKQAASLNADMLFVHHGIFWGQSPKIVGVHYDRVREFFNADMALYAVHLPLDAHPVYGNNAGLAARLNLQDIVPFGDWRGVKIGCSGVSCGMDIETLVKRLFPDGEKPISVLPFGKKEIRTVGIISGGASDDLSQAIDAGLDLYITGELKHQAYHEALENKINVIAGGHYQTETVGVKLVAEKLRSETYLETVFIDLPTGL
ncbi:MAG: Nif3-like dinuclear metal center hexameric protein [Treponema sp.]|nr:MAG: Nif3-like dinuclear metal center hexameric protein [Treponema sp.]